MTSARATPSQSDGAAGPSQPDGAALAGVTLPAEDAPLAEVIEAHRQLRRAVAAATAATDQPGGAEAGARARAHLESLQEAAFGLLEDRVLARLWMTERVQAATGRLRELGPVSEILQRSVREARHAADLDRVVLSRVEEGWLRVEAVDVAERPEEAAATLAALQNGPARLDYPQIEAEMMRRRRPLLVTDAAHDPHGRPAHADTLGWDEYVLAPVVLDRRVVAFLHGDRGVSQRPLTTLERDALAAFAQEFAVTLENAVLRGRLRRQREEMRRVASWADSRTSQLSDRAVDLAGDRFDDDEDTAGAPEAGPALRDLLTPREIDVLEHMATGDTNAAIARSLVVSEGTVKFHVKNILRKLQAANRAEATSRYLQLRVRSSQAPR